MSTENHEQWGEKILDYVYDELPEGEQATMRAHVEGCARCQAEVESFGRVRSATRAIAQAEPPVAATAKLLYQAAQLAGPAKILPLTRRQRVARTLRHPGFAAAAAFLIVGGVAGWQLFVQRAPVAQPPRELAAAAPAPIVEPAPPTAGDHAAAPEGSVEVSKAKKESAPVDPDVALANRAPEPPAAKDAPTRTAAVKAPARAHAAGGSFAPAGDDRGGASGLTARPLSEDGKRDQIGAQGGPGKSQGGGWETNMPSTRSPVADKLAERPAPPPPVAVREEKSKKGLGSQPTAESSIDEAMVAPAKPQRVAQPAPKSAPSPLSPFMQAQAQPQAPQAQSSGGVSPSANPPGRPLGAGQNQELARSSLPASPSRYDDSAVAEGAGVVQKNAAAERRRALDSYSTSGKPVPAPARPPTVAAGRATTAGDAQPLVARFERSVKSAAGCREADDAYRQLRQQFPEHVTSKMRLEHARCLKLVGNYPDARGELLQLGQQAPELSGQIKNELHAIDAEQQQRTVDAARSARPARKKAATADEKPAPAEPTASPSY